MNACIYKALRHKSTANPVMQDDFREAMLSRTTRHRVPGASEEHNYLPMRLDQSRVESRSFSLGLIVEDFANPFYLEMADEIQRHALDQGYRLIICDSMGDAQRAKEQLDVLQDAGIDGLITLAALRIEDVYEVAQRGLPLVLCNWTEDVPLPNLPTVNVEIRLAGYLAGRHLVGLGHRRIAAIASSNPEPYQDTYPRRLEGLLRALKEASISVPEAYIKMGYDSPTGAYLMARVLLSLPNRPSAIFASNDVMAAEVLKAAKHMDIRVPQELSIIGVDDIKWSAFTSPALTTIMLPKKRLAETIMTSLFRQLKDQKLDELHNWVVPALIKRQTTAPPLNSLLTDAFSYLS